MLMLLSLSTMSMSLGVADTLLSPSKASPPLIAPSPITATTLRPLACVPPPSASWRFSATAMPSAADIELLAWPHTNVSYSLSSGEGNGIMPCSLRLVQNASRRPVRILCP